MAIRRLVLLANQYPFLTGDHVFVDAEMPALAARFDEVVVFNHAPAGAAAMVEMPDNVRYGGTLYGTSRIRKVLALVSPRSLGTLARVALTEWRTGRLKGHEAAFLMGAVAAMGLANDRRLRMALYEEGVETTVYSFWGMGIGVLVPWLRSGIASVNLRLHGYDLYEERSGYLPFRPSMFRRSDRILTISNQAGNYLTATYPEERLASKTFVRRLGSGAPMAGAVLENGSLAEGSDMVASQAHTVVSCSHLIALKRVSRILDALEMMPLDRPLTWIHFGGGTLEEELRQRANEIQRPGLTLDIRGAMPHQEILEFYRDNAVAAFINVSTTEGVPVSIMEAISYGIPVVATDVGGTAEIVGKELRTGELIPGDFSDSDLVAALQQLLGAEPGSYEPRKLWAERYDAEVNAAVTAQLLAEKPKR